MLSFSTIPQQLLIATGLVLVSGGLGFFSGCEYKEDKLAKERLAQVKAAAKLEKTDAVAGVNVVAKLRKQESDAIEAGKILSGAPKQALVRVVSTTTACAPQVATSQGVDSTSVTKEKLNETAPAEVTLSKHAMWLYDLSLQPGNAELRAGIYEAARELGINEGLSLTFRNNLQCVQWKNQLNSLIDRIEAKQKIFKDKE